MIILQDYLQNELIAKVYIIKNFINGKNKYISKVKNECYDL